MYPNPTSSSPRLRAGALAFLMGATILAGCDTSGAVRETDSVAVASPAANALVDTLKITAATRTKVEAAIASHQNKATEPGYLWYVAEELQASLTAEEKAELLASAPAPGDRMAMRPNRRGARAGRARHGIEAGRDRRGKLGDFGSMIPDLTDEQRAQIQAIHEAHADEFQALRKARREEALTPEEMRSRHEALRAQIHEEMAEVLTDEQEAALNARHDAMQARADTRRSDRRERRADRQERFEERQAVAVEVLNLTAEQQEALAALREAQQAEARALADRVRTGELDREAARDTLLRQHAEHEAARAEILTHEQLETMQIHHVLAKQAFKRHLRSTGRRR